MPEVLYSFVVTGKDLDLWATRRIFELDDRSAPLELEEPHFEKLEIVPALLLPEKFVCL